MKVLVTGQNSYAGTQFSKRISDLNKRWEIDFVSVRDNTWKHKDFSLYDAIYHVAGIVHKKETAENKDIYYKVNRDLTYQLALKAKKEGVKSFVFLSTMAVYGLIGKIGEDTIISKETKPAPTSNYGKSKLEAEGLLEELQSSNFNISILRIPMIYGPNCPGNYSSLSKLARKIPVFPKIDNKRSMIFVDHLSDIVIHIIEKKLLGVFLVKNPEDLNTLEIVSVIGEYHGKRIYKSSFLGFIFITFGNRVSTFRKMFGNMVFQETDCYISGFEFKKLSLEESISLAEGKELGGKY
ncbi:NAD-dependent epimerase/dehydratase family protein [Planomicrobium okeanokoites]|uniref:NAD-dependent epimerase/dehydratase family protein n=1 Tax=Planomicrobium okeanokoites TaxID=244 RepID=UPI002492F917|nr:NAD-dependent epimerase/dehydratase family protein [Planomicrobium okeanokoites]